MRYIVQPGNTLWSIASAQLGDGSKWQHIAKLNGLVDPFRIFAGQELIIDDSAVVGRSVHTNRVLSRGGMCYGYQHTGAPVPGGSASSASLIPAAAYVFVLADEINPLTEKVVRRVVVHPRMAEDLSRHLGRPMNVFNNPERYGFNPTAPNSSLPVGRHAQGMKPSPFSSASTRSFGATRFSGTPFWIDVAKVEAAGATIHSTNEIVNDLDRIIAKTKNVADIEKLQGYKALVTADAEILIKGDVPASAVKGSAAMAGTRVLQGVQIVGFAMSAVNLAHATEKSIIVNSPKPVVAETIRQVGGWGAAWAGMKIGAAGGTLLGIETGPGALVTGAVGGVAGGVAGYFGFDWIADLIDEN